jgi:hypothetical protein
VQAQTGNTVNATYVKTTCTVVVTVTWEVTTTTTLLQAACLSELSSLYNLQYECFKVTNLQFTHNTCFSCLSGRKSTFVISSVLTPHWFVPICFFVCWKNNAYIHTYIHTYIHQGAQIFQKSWSFLPILDTRRAIRSKAHTEDSQFWHYLWTSLLCGAFCLVHMNWKYTFVCNEKSAITMGKILGTTIHPEFVCP